MKHIKNFKLFESQILESRKYRQGDIVKFRYWATQDMALGRITEWYDNKKYCLIQLCDRWGAPINGTNPFMIKKSEIVAPHDLVTGPVLYKNPANIPADFIRRDMIRMSNDIAHHGIF